MFLNVRKRYSVASAKGHFNGKDEQGQPKVAAQKNKRKSSLPDVQLFAWVRIGRVFLFGQPPVEEVFYLAT